MTHPKLTPPPELVRAWQREANHNEALFPQVAAFAAQWGYDQREPEIQAATDRELDACIQWMVTMGYWGEDGKAIPALRAARRPSPEPPSLKGQALEQLNCVEGILRNLGVINTDIIRRAVEALPE
jgi:hypothetical protein